MSSFFGIEIAKKSLLVNQRAIELTAHNLANATTAGYSRQVLNTRAIVPAAGNALKNTGASNIGAGVDIVSITSVRNGFYDAMYRKENASLSEMSAKSTALLYIEDVIGEGAKGGLLDTLSAVYDDIDLLSQNAESTLYREQLRQDVITLTNSLNHTAAALHAYRREQDQNVQSIVGKVNELANRVAELNHAIFKYELSGNRANDLRDQRSLLVDELSGLADTMVHESADGKLTVTLGGVSLVSHISVHRIELKPGDPDPATGTMYVTPTWADSGIKVAPASGTLRGALDIRDSQSPTDPGIPYYLSRLDTLAASLVEVFNAVNSAGYTLPYGEKASRTGVNFFSPDHTHAYDITLSDELLESGANIAASSEPVSGAENWSNAENLKQLLALRDSSHISSGGVTLGNHESFMRTLITDIATAAHYTAGRAKTQQEMADAMDELRLSVSGVSIDEETINLVRYQQSYQAAAKLVTVLDEMLSTLINL